MIAGQCARTKDLTVDQYFKLLSILEDKGFKIRDDCKLVSFKAWNLIGIDYDYHDVDLYDNPWSYLSHSELIDPTKPWGDYDNILSKKDILKFIGE